MTCLNCRWWGPYTEANGHRHLGGRFGNKTKGWCKRRKEWWMEDHYCAGHEPKPGEQGELL